MMTHTPPSPFIRVKRAYARHAAGRQSAVSLATTLREGAASLRERLVRQPESPHRAFLEETIHSWEWTAAQIDGHLERDALRDLRARWERTFDECDRRRRVLKALGTCRHELRKHEANAALIADVEALMTRANDALVAYEPTLHAAKCAYDEARAKADVA